MSWLSNFVRQFFPKNENRYPDEDDLDTDNSVVDLMKSKGMDSSFAARRKLAASLGRPSYSGSAEDNIWLHGKVKGG
jgi:hypothetical protein